MERDSVTVGAPRLRWAIWLVAMAGYTYLLVVPNDWLPPWLRHTVGTQITSTFTFGKLAHVACYAILTLGTFLLPLGWLGWMICVAIMSLHGMGTEYVQTFTGRHGCWSDVGIDHIGIVTGLLLCGLGYRLRSGWSTCQRAERIMPPPQVEAEGGREDGHADPL
jgi:hypothetical protein